ncbi:SH3 domain-binding glutamic acid-rich-like protein 3 [Cetorhinus maximus]
MVITVYYTTITSTSALERNQKKIIDMLDALHIPYNLLDLAADGNLLAVMRDKVGDCKAMVPQVFNGDQYCGDYTAFEQAMENEKVKEFFKVDGQQKH